MTPPLAAIFAARLALPAVDWSEVIIPIVVFTIWVINAIASANKNKPQPRPPAARPAGQNPRQGRGPLEEVEQFLREARKAMDAQQRPQQRPQQVPPRQPQRAAAQKQKPTARLQKPTAKKPDKPQQRKSISDAPRLKSQLVERDLDEVRRGDSVSQHVQQHLGTDKFDDRAGQFSHIKRSVDQDINAHVKSAFDHQVGRLAQQGDGSAAQPTSALGESPAVQIAELLRDPQNLRNAIILQEILQPPTHRW